MKSNRGFKTPAPLPSMIGIDGEPFTFYPIVYKNRGEPILCKGDMLYLMGDRDTAIQVDAKGVGYTFHIVSEEAKVYLNPQDLDQVWVRHNDLEEFNSYLLSPACG